MCEASVSEWNESLVFPLPIRGNVGAAGDWTRLLLPSVRGSVGIVLRGV